MKVIKSLVLATLLVFVTTLSAANKPTTEKKSIPEVSQEIAEMLKGPSFEVKEDVFAYVSLMVNEDDELVVLSVKTKNETVEKFVKARLNYQKISSKLEHGKEYKLPLTIVSQS